MTSHSATGSVVGGVGLRYGSTNQANSAVHSFEVGKWVVGLIDVITLITGVETIKRLTRAAYGCLIAGQSPMAAGLAYAL